MVFLIRVNNKGVSRGSQDSRAMALNCLTSLEKRICRGLEHTYRAIPLESDILTKAVSHNAVQRGFLRK